MVVSGLKGSGFGSWTQLSGTVDGRFESNTVEQSWIETDDTRDLLPSTPLGLEVKELRRESEIVVVVSELSQASAPKPETQPELTRPKASPTFPKAKEREFEKLQPLTNLIPSPITPNIKTDQADDPTSTGRTIRARSSARPKKLQHTPEISKAETPPPKLGEKTSETSRACLKSISKKGTRSYVQKKVLRDDLRTSRRAKKRRILFNGSAQELRNGDRCGK